MGTELKDARETAQAASAALQAGRHADARDLLQSLVDAGRADASVHLALARACRALGDHAAALAAADRVLAMSPRDPRALIAKADSFDALGDGRAAAAHYGSALRAAPQPVPPDLVPELRRAQAATERYRAEFEASLREGLRNAGALEGGNDRFSRAFDVLLGKRQVYLQQPRFFYYPELPNIQFYERAAFPWMDAVEAATDAIREELLGVMAGHEGFVPYLQRDPTRPQTDRYGLLDSLDWSAFYLVKNGAAVPDAQARCPRTMQALAVAPLCDVPGRSPSVLFSVLKAGARIPPHHGFVNTRLICHLPLIVPQGCGFRVGNDTRAWEEGRAWAFDDTIEHEAWNTGKETRVILLFDVWRPELSDEERRKVAALFAAIDAHQGPGQEWTA